jgi:radical SAM-linked protein
MAPEATPATPTPAQAAPSAELPRCQHKVRIRFRKLAALRLLSHHDLMRTFERLLRRAEVPFHRSQGFHPKPRLVFALSLPLGVIGRDEVADLELAAEMTPETLHERLARQAPPGLEILSVCRIPPRSGLRVHGLTYTLPIAPAMAAELRRRSEEVLAAPFLWVDRTRPPRRRLDLRPLIRDLRLAEETHRTDTPRLLLVMDLWLRECGTARPEEVLRLIHLEELLDSGAVLERTRLELDDELPPPPAPHGRGPAPAAGGAPEPVRVAHEERDAD